MRRAFGVMLLDFATEAPIGAFQSKPVLRRRAQAVGERRASCRPAASRQVFTWMRPNDLVWNYWVNNYLTGQRSAELRYPGVERRTAPTCRARCTRSSSTSSETILSPKVGAMQVLGGSPSICQRIKIETLVTER